MPNTRIDIRDEMGARVPGVSQISIVPGNTFTVSSPDVDTTLYLSPALVSILSPDPGAVVALTAGIDLTCSFTSAAPGAYQIILQAPEADAPQHFDPAPEGAPVLVLKAGDGIAFPVTSNPIQTLAVSQPLGFMAQSDPEEPSITSNPIQT